MYSMSSAYLIGGIIIVVLVIAFFVIRNVVGKQIEEDKSDEE